MLFRSLLIYSNNNRTKKTRLALRDEAFSILTSVIVAVLNTSYMVAKPDLKNSSLNFSGLLSLLLIALKPAMIMSTLCFTSQSKYKTFVVIVYYSLSFIAFDSEEFNRIINPLQPFFKRFCFSCKNIHLTKGALICQTGA